jgi:hypothetical protein
MIDHGDNMKRIVATTLLALTGTLLGACAPKQPPAPVCVGQACQPLPPGTTQFVWEEPMVDTVDVPPGVDPEGIYYRPAHKEVVEVRQGRYKNYKQK